MSDDTNMQTLPCDRTDQINRDMKNYGKDRQERKGQKGKYPSLV